ncbi:MAG: hypothetical protein B7Z02_15340 [Rhodobacterales bacterium 32-67-9]|nr:MAG: hypothetical protein B7Z02_15340 [Rhodobacterales bacterium 32-67-9]
MSDPLANLEIQDVLSSIRRLVSEDSRRRPQQPKERAEGQSPVPENKLVLTDALRVPEAEVRADVLPEGEDTLRQSVAGDGVFDEAEGLPDAGVPLPDGSALLRDWETDSAAEAQSLEDTIAELEAAVAGIGGEFEPDGSEVAARTRTDAALEDAFEDGFAVDVAAETESEELARDVTSGDLRSRQGRGQDGAAAADLPDAAGPAERREDRATETGSDETGADDTRDDGAEDDQVGDSGTELSDESGGEDRSNGATPAFVHVGAMRSSQAVSETAPAGSGRIRRLTLTAADAVPAEAGRTDGGGAEGGRWDRDDAPGAETLIHADAAVDDGVDADEAVGLFSAGDEAVIDMDMLRDLVAEIIREELQGPLGERITRNVRMLVRREINRALESRSLD